MRYILMLLVVLLPFSALAVDTRQLSEAQRAEIEAQVAQMKLANSKGEDVEVTAERLSRYAEVGQSVASAIGAAAKELGVAVNDFMRTPAGILAGVLIVYHFIGADLVTFVVLICFCLPLVLFLYLRFMRWVRIDYIEYADRRGWWIFSYRPKKVVMCERFNDDQGWSVVIASLVHFVVAVTLVINGLP